FMPDAAARIGATVGAAETAWPDLSGDLLNALPVGQSVAAPEVLFRKIEDAQVEEWRVRFGGAEAEPA
ncbi:MAG TPA: methionine--tRNA ligase, partial [Phenylobacterium sp.]|nr:methionine--tRNA ligase [Phenylobacterium sp.]